ncbi:MAG: hypothetical protein JWM56_1229 [Candidatus Peribacteria bacterium]|nr:hypothetical protein [Candidatus Peribacteria bacterium]
MDFITPLILVAGFGVVIYFLTKKTAAPYDTGAELRLLQEQVAQVRAALEQKTEQVGKLETQIEMERSERNQMEGKGKQMFSQFKQMEMENQKLIQDKEELQIRLSRYDAERDRREQEFQDRIAKLEAADMSLKQERIRVIREDEEKILREKEEYDRMWNEHEVSVIGYLSTICKEPAYAFKSFDNTNLPDDFDGSLKPDFMIEFLDQYVVFDAKVSKAESLQTYITNTVKSTALKLKKSTKMYPTVFFVVPTNAIGELKRTYFSQDGFTFYVICPESIPVILSTFKRIAAYELAEQLDPQQRENIVNLIAELDFHINLRNAADLFLSKLGTNLLDRTHELQPDLAEEVERKKRELRSPFNVAEVKKMILSTTLQNDEIDRMISPKASVKNAYVETIKEEFMQQLL